MFNFSQLAHLLYLVLAIGVTVFVATMLRRKARVLLAEAFGGNESLADSLGYLSIVTFYLLNFGVIAFALRWGTKPADGLELLEYVSTKIGIVLLILGVLHSLKVRRILGLRRRAGEVQRKES